MKLLKIVGGLLLAWVVVVILFESLIGYFQPTDDQTTLVITTTNEGESSDRVLTSIKADGNLYVAANHWPRAWYREALENPRVDVIAHWDAGAASGTYEAVPVKGDEHERVAENHPLPLLVRVLTGFPPRCFLRLDPI